MRSAPRDRPPATSTFARYAFAVRARLVLGRDLLEVRHADDPAVAAEQDRLDAVLRLAALNDQRRGPKPTKNSVTFMPVRLAVTKCASSCSMMITGASARPRRGDLRREHERVRDTAATATDAIQQDCLRRTSTARRARTGLLTHAPSFDTAAGPLAARRSASRTSATSSAFPVPAFSDFLDDFRDRGPRDALGEERLDRDLVAPLRIAGAVPPARPAS